jgi:hypothetical protein
LHPIYASSIYRADKPVAVGSSLLQGRAVRVLASDAVGNIQPFIVRRIGALADIEDNLETQMLVELQRGVEITDIDVDVKN